MRALRAIFISVALLSSAQLAAQSIDVPPPPNLFESTLIIQLCYTLIVCLCISILVILTMLFYRRAIRIRTSKKAQKLKHYYEDLLTRMVLDDDSKMKFGAWKLKKVELLEFLYEFSFDRTLKRSVLREQVLLLHKNLSGSASKRLRDLYIECGFQREAMRKLKNPNWHIKAQAVHELAEMEITEATEPIRKLIRHKNAILRLESQTATLMLDSNEPFAFLNSEKAHISEWHEINLYHIIKKLDRKLIPEFDAYFYSPNPSVITFSIKMVVMFNQFESARKLVMLFSHPINEVRMKAVKAVGALELAEAESELLKLYNRADHPLKNEILLALGKISGSKSLEFLNEKIQSDNFDTAFHAASALKLAGTRGENMLRQSAGDAGNKIRMAVAKHFLDNRI